MDTLKPRSITDQTKLQDFVHKKVAETPSIMPRSLALKAGVPMLRVIHTLPEHMRLQVPRADFEKIWKTMVQWEKVTFMAETPGMIIEVPCRLCEGIHGHGMYNLMDKSSPLNGHILLDDINEIWLVSKPIFGLESHSVQFFSRVGDLCFSVYLGRNEEREIIPSVKESYLRLWESYAALQTKKEPCRCAV